MRRDADAAAEDAFQLVIDAYGKAWAPKTCAHVPRPPQLRDRRRVVEPRPDGKPAISKAPETQSERPCRYDGTDP